MKKITLKIALVLFTASTMVFAEEKSNISENREELIKQREQNQQKRIDEGVKSGAINAEESQKLQKQQEKIKKVEQKATEDGRVSKKEFNKIEKMQKAASHSIKHKKTNKH
ncbi:MAG: hypothetical protein HUU56_14595 [Bdellovibrionaceae bacterium]|nr:hypothetical protein [Pseudobdellovibrionaceae bacterium]